MASNTTDLGEQPHISLIIPAYNEQSRLQRTLTRLLQFVESLDQPCEILVVANGCTDDTVRVAREIANGHRSLRVLELTERGKGRAVKAGVMEARGRYIGFADADLSWPMELLPEFAERLNCHDDQVLIGSREGVGSRRVGEPYYRHLMGRVFNFLVRLLVVPGVQDTQCGFKWFSRRAAREIFSRQSLTGWGFDVEVLFIARRLGYQVQEVPITWTHDPNSRVRPLADALCMLRDVLMVRLNDLRGRYDVGPKG